MVAAEKFPSQIGLIKHESYHVDGIRYYFDQKYHHLIGSAYNAEDQEHVVNTLRHGEPHRIVSTLVEGRVAGFVWDALHRPSTQRVIEIKSSGDIERRDLFSLVIPLYAVERMIDKSKFDQVEDLEALQGQTFVQLPLKDKYRDRLGPSYYSDDEGISWGQFFIPKPDSFLYNLAYDAINNNPRTLLAGTSANPSGAGSIVDRVEAVAFCSVLNGVYWLDKVGLLEHMRGSFPIVRLSNSGVTTIRKAEELPKAKPIPQVDRSKIIQFPIAS